MNIRDQLDPILEKWNLLNHPFYRAWSEGRLSTEALQLYASEYGDFIALLPRGWERMGDTATTDEEREHVELWNEFAAALGGSVSPASLLETRELAHKAAGLFTDPASALGALYAFEAQQPATAKSKLEGLQAHYGIPERGQAYFHVHQNNAGEAQAILERLDRMSESEQTTALVACETMAEALWEALSAIQAGAGQE